MLMLVVEHQEERPGVVRISIRGRMMLGEESSRVDTLLGELLATGYRHFVFDLAGLTHIDSTGIGRFIAGYNRVLPVDGATMYMAAATGAVRSAFRVTKLDTVFPFFETVEAAVHTGKSG